MISLGLAIDSDVCTSNSLVTTVAWHTLRLVEIRPTKELGTQLVGEMLRRDAFDVVACGCDI